MVGDDRRLAAAGDDAAFDRVEVQRQKLQTVGRMTHEIAFQQDLRDARAIAPPARHLR